MGMGQASGMNAASPGAGGSGAVSVYYSAAAVGGKGADGMCVVTEYILA